ncbi:MAG TPA: hypothetical protein PK878_16175 [bacterium]|nr:hypothetical protein [Candidatus Omnitrophota bacterium]HOJ61822.1 hypothetical protein [bacterium]HOL95082.1 hypothetical protein [bacterium]HPP01744.1 hypothetical protein [bacterium]HXK92517.1 hypothetical protein [bacterium]
MFQEPSVQEKLDYLVKTTGQRAGQVIADALEHGLTELYRRHIKSAYLDGGIGREEAISRLGEEMVAEIDYARGAVTRDVMWGLNRE